MSVPAVTDRIRKLQEASVITSFQAIIDPRMIGLDVSALITIISESSAHYTEVVGFAKKTEDRANLAVPKKTDK